MWLSFFEGTPRNQELTDKYLTEIEGLLRAALDKTFALAVAIGATKLGQTPMSRCTHVPQDYPGGHCLSACLQSFLIDNDKSPPSQKEMLNQAKAQKLCGPTGEFVLSDNVEKFCALFGIDVEKIGTTKFQRTWRMAGNTDGCWNYNDAGEHHCVRFCEYVSAEKFRVMNPAARNAEERFREMETTQIAQWKCDIFRIRLKR